MPHKKLDIKNSMLAMLHSSNRHPLHRVALFCTLQRHKPRSSQTFFAKKGVGISTKILRRRSLFLCMLKRVWGSKTTWIVIIMLVATTYQKMIFVFSSPLKFISIVSFFSFTCSVVVVYATSP